MSKAHDPYTVTVKNLFGNIVQVFYTSKLPSFADVERFINDSDMIIQTCPSNACIERNETKYPGCISYQATLGSSYQGEIIIQKTNSLPNFAEFVTNLPIHERRNF